MTISKEAVETIRYNSNVKARLMMRYKRSHAAIENWIKDESDMLTTFDSVKIIGEETGMPVEKILVEEGATA